MSKPTDRNETRPQTQKPLKLAPQTKKKVSANLTKMRLLNTCSGAFFAYGAYGLIDPQSVLEWAEVALLGAAGGLSAYAVNHISITKGAYQSAIKVPGAMVASLGAMGIAAGTISIASFNGAVINPIDKMRVQEFGQEHIAYVEKRISNARSADQVIVAVEAAHGQVKAARICEETASCVSRRGNGGKGTAYYTLQNAETEIATVLEKLTDSTDARDKALEALEESKGDFQRAVRSANPSRQARRSKVQEQLSVQEEALAALDRAVPLSLVEGLAEGLERGVSIPGNADLSARISERLSKAGSGVSKALGKADAEDVSRVSLPPETGVMETLKWIGYYLPLAGVVLLIDGVFPILLWFFTFSALRQTVEPEEAQDDDPFDFSNTVEMPPVQMERIAHVPSRAANRARRH